MSAFVLEMPEDFAVRITREMAGDKFIIQGNLYSCNRKLLHPIKHTEKHKVKKIR